MRKHFTTSILLWVRTDQPRPKGMDHWKGPHSGIISATPGLQEYRQIHLAEANPGLYLRRNDGTSGRAFRKLGTSQLARALIDTGRLKELRTQVFLPWRRRLSDTPTVAHDNPAVSAIHADDVAATLLADGDYAHR
jgi:hypothetical protein